jgi:excisionase family DNA binding protein
VRVGTVKDVMALLLCSDDTVYELAANGEIPTLRRIGSQLRFDLDEVESWLRDPIFSRNGGDAA